MPKAGIHKTAIRLKSHIFDAELDLRAFPSLYPEESQELRLQRLQAFKHTWQAFESNMKVCSLILNPSLIYKQFDDVSGQ